MAKKLKYSIISVISVFVILGISVLSIPYFIDAHVLREGITKAVEDSTGRTLTINGDIKWSFIPHFSVELDQAALANPTDFPEKSLFATIRQLKLNVELLPLILSKRIIMNELILNDATINLTTLANGQTNWQDLLAKPLPTNTSASASAQKETAQTNAKAPPINFNIAQLELNNGDLIWDNQQRNERWELSELNIDSSSISFDQHFPLTISGKLKHPPSDQVITLSLNADATVNPAQETYVLKSLKVNGNVVDKNNPQGEKIDISLDELQINSQTKLFVLNKLVLDALGSHANGSLNIKNSGQYPQLAGDFKIDQITLGKLKVTDVDLPVNGQNGVYAMQPVTAKFYEGTLNANVTLNNSIATPQWQFSYQLSDVQMQALLKDLDGNDKLTGTGATNGQFTANGFTSDSILNSLTGATQVQLKDGSLQGIDISYWWQVGNKLLQGDPNISGLTDTKNTKIANLSGNFTFNHGVGTTNNLQMYNDVIFVHAEGEIDLVKQYVNLNLSVSQSSNGQPTGTAIPLVMSGSFGNISVKPDEKTIAVMASKALTSKAGQGLVNKLTDKAPESLKQPLHNAITGAVNKLSGK